MSYMSKCIGCETMFTGDKHAWHCETCANKAITNPTPARLTKDLIAEEARRTCLDKGYVAAFTQGAQFALNAVDTSARPVQVGMSDAAALLGKYKKLCLEIKRGDGYHLARIDKGIASLTAYGTGLLAVAEAIEKACPSEVDPDDGAVLVALSAAEVVALRDALAAPAASDPDGERYRWLRAHHTFHLKRIASYGQKWAELHFPWVGDPFDDRHETMDAAIDAAMKGDQP